MAMVSGRIVTPDGVNHQTAVAVHDADALNWMPNVNCVVLTFTVAPPAWLNSVYTVTGMPP